MFLAHGDCSCDSSGGHSKPKRQGHLSVLLVTADVPGHFHSLLALADTLDGRGHNVSMMTVGMEEKKLEKVCARRGIELHTYGELTVNVSDGVRRASQSRSPFTLLSSVAPLLFDAQDILISSFAKYPEKLIHSNDVVVLDLFFPLVTRWLNTNTNLTVISFTQMTPISTESLPWWHFPRVNPLSSPYPLFTERLATVAFEVVRDAIMNTVGYYYKHNLPVYSPAGVYNPDIVTVAFGFDFPRPLYPMVHYVGPVVTNREELLLDELQSWLDRHPLRSVLYISMGSVHAITEQLATVVVNTARRLGYSILWSLRKSDQHILSKLEENALTSGMVFASSWLPQATVLRHPSISIAVLHCGLGGLNEAMMAGVPVIGSPASLATDQPSNCLRMHHQGLGVCLHGAGNITSDLLQRSIKEIERGSYRETIRKLNLIFKEAGGVERAADLIEHYHEVGYDHLVPFWAKHQWSTVQYYNLDVYAVLAGVLVLVVFTLYKCTCCVGRRICSRQQSTVKAKKD